MTDKPFQTMPVWRRIEEYEHPKYAGFDPIALVVWWHYGAGGYSEGVRWFGCGY
jgi:hypothetical protein